MEYYPYFLKNNESPGSSLSENKAIKLGTIIISKQTIQFGAVDNIHELYKLIDRKGEMCLFEVVLSDVPQKFRLDVDIPIKEYNWDIRNDESLVNGLVSYLQILFETYDVTLKEKDIRIYQSHGPEKRSYHFVIDNYTFVNNKKVGLLYKEFILIMERNHIENFDSDWIKYVDRSVYSSFQNFRLLWSQKKDSGRIKKLVNFFKFNGKEIFRKEPETKEERLSELKKSLLSYHYDSTIITKVSNGSIAETKKYYNDLTPSMIKKALEFLGKMDNQDCFDVDKTYDNLILLKRLRPSYCEKCNRIHEAENPYLSVVNDEIFFNCRRHGQPQKLGKSTVFSEKRRGIFNTDYVKNNSLKLPKKGTYDMVLSLGNTKDLRIGDNEMGYTYKPRIKQKIQTTLTFCKGKLSFGKNKLIINKISPDKVALKRR